MGFGCLAAVFLALLSVFYLKQLPTQDDASRLASDLKIEHDFVLAANQPFEVELVRTREKGKRVGVRITCALRPGLTRNPKQVDLCLQRLGQSALIHPEWSGRIRYAEVVHAGLPERSLKVVPVEPTSVKVGAAPSSG